MLLTDDVSHVPVSLRSFVGGGEGLQFWDSPSSSSVVLEDKYFLFCLCRSIGDGMLGWEWMNILIIYTNTLSGFSLLSSTRPTFVGGIPLAL